MSNLYARPSLEPLEGRLAPADYFWTGAVGASWHDPGNWEDANGFAVTDVPGLSDRAVIGDETTDPLVHGVGAAVGGLELYPGATLRLQENFAVSDQLGAGDTVLRAGSKILFEGEIELIFQDQAAGDIFQLAGTFETPAFYVDSHFQSIRLNDCDAVVGDGLTFDGIDELVLGDLSLATLTLSPAGGDVFVTTTPMPVMLYDGELIFPGQGHTSTGGNWLADPAVAADSAIQLLDTADAKVVFGGSQGRGTFVDVPVLAHEGEVIFQDNAWVAFTGDLDIGGVSGETEAYLILNDWVFIGMGGGLGTITVNGAAAAIRRFTGDGGAIATVEGRVLISDGGRIHFETGPHFGTLFVDSLAVDGGELWMRGGSGPGEYHQVHVNVDVEIITAGALRAYPEWAPGDPPAQFQVYRWLVHDGAWFGDEGSDGLVPAPSFGWPVNYSIDHDTRAGTWDWIIG